MLKFLKWRISCQLFIRKHSYLDHRYPGGSAFSPWLLTPGSISQGGARDQNIGYLKKVFFYFSVMETTYADTPQPLNNIVGIQASSRVSYPICFILRVECIDYVRKGILNSHLGSSTDSCYIQIRVITNRVIKRFGCSWSDMSQPCDMDLWVMKWRSAWPIFHGPVILLYILKTVWCMNIILWDMSLYDTTLTSK